MGVAAVDRGGQRLRTRLGLALAGLLLAAGCRPPLAGDPESMFYLLYEGPPRLPATFKSGTFSTEPVDSWFCFTSMETYKIRDLDRWRAADAAEQVAAFKPVCPDPILETPARLQALQWSDGRAGKLILSDTVTGRYFYRSWKVQ